MRLHINMIFALLAAIIGGVLVFSPPLRAADPTPIACPNAQTIFLEGQTSPREALLIHMRGRAVGGGLSGGDGRFRLPLRPQERPGIYSVEVRLRSNGNAVAAFNCYVDVAFESVATATELVALTAAPPATAPRSIPPPLSPTVGRTTATPTSTQTNLTGNATATPRTTTTITATTTVTTTTTPITPVPAGSITIETVELRDPTFPDSTEESVQIVNTTDQPVTITGWRLLNASRPELPSFVFPSFSLSTDVKISVFSGVGNNDTTRGHFFWGQLSDVWGVGDRAELRDPQGRLVSSLSVPNQNE